MQSRPSVRSSAGIIATHHVLRNTYMLLSMTLLFSAVTAGYAMVANVHPPGFLITIVGMFGLLYLTQAMRNTGWGVLCAFAFTGFMGYTLGPTLNFYVHALSNGSEIIFTALGTTGLIFLSMSAYVLSTGKDFSYMGGMLMGGIVAVIIASMAAIVFQMPMASLVVSAFSAVLFTGYLLYQTSAIIHGGETNYIMATIGLYVSLLNLFMSLLQILAFFSGSSRD